MLEGDYRMRGAVLLLLLAHTAWAAAVGAVSPISSISSLPAGSPSTYTIGNHTNPPDVLTITITSLIPQPSDHSSTSVLTLTLTLNSTALTNQTILSNGTEILSNGTVLATNGSIIGNGTTKTTWHEGDAWIPFQIVIDPAYGIPGALLIISGLPVAMLGGKNRWTSIAVVSGYSMMLFTLVLILRFGVQPSLEPPSPSPPSASERGLYLVACVISFLIGAGQGIFFFNIARYCIAAAGGFVFAWFLLEVKSGGLIDNILGRWALLGGLTIASFVASMPRNWTDVMLLLSTAWIGATTFTLGIDSYTRAGLKEFYMYNLGFHSLFPKLDGGRYPLTQTMEIELGILAAMVIVGCAVQTRVLTLLRGRLRTIREEEEMRLEAQEVSRAAEKFKNVGADLAEWESKHSRGSSPPSYSSPQLECHGSNGRSGINLLKAGIDKSTDGSSHLDLSPTLTTTDWLAPEELKDDFGPSPTTRGTLTDQDLLRETDLGDQMRLLDQVRRARESIRGSLDELRRGSPTPTTDLLSPALALTRSQTPGSDTSTAVSRRSSAASNLLLRPLDQPGRQRASSAASAVTAVVQPVPMQRAASSTSVMDRPRFSSYMDHALETSREQPSPSPETFAILAPSPRPKSTSELSATSPLAEWDRYLSSRQVVYPANPGSRPVSLSVHTGSRISQPMVLSVVPEHGSKVLARKHRSSANLHAEIRHGEQTSSLIQPAFGASVPTMKMARSMSYEQLNERHSRRLSSLQQPVTAKMKVQAERSAGIHQSGKESRIETGRKS